MSKNLSFRTFQRSKNFCVYQDEEENLYTLDGQLIHTFDNLISTLVDLPDGGIALSINGQSYGDRNIFSFIKDGSLRWQNSNKKVTRLGRPLDGKAQVEVVGFHDLFFETGAGENRKRADEYFEGSILATLSAWNDLYSIDMKTGEIEFVRNTGSHDHV